MAPFHNYHPGSQHLTLRIKDGRRTEVAGGRSNAGLAGTGDLKRAKDSCAHQKVPPAFVSMRSRFASVLKGLGTKFQGSDEVQMNNLGINKLHSCTSYIIHAPRFSPRRVGYCFVDSKLSTLSSPFLPDHQNVLYQLTG